MPAADNCEPQVIHALERDGWQVIKHHYLIRLGKGRGAVYADLRLQKDTTQILVVEIKCFEKRSSQMEDLYQAIGQYMVYQKALQLDGIIDALYLAMPEPVFHHLSVHDAIREVLKDAKIKISLIDLGKEEVIEWIH